ncbi:MAG: class I SAM-dependent methyltransferase [Novipirellula sp. JB048]
MTRFPLFTLSLLALLTTSPLRAQTTVSPEPAVVQPALDDPAPSHSGTSVKPGINDSFLDPKLDVQAWVERLAVERREVYHARDALLAHLPLRPGDRVADVGAGTGFYSLLMSKAVGSEGWVYAVEISPGFVSHLADQFSQRDVRNVTTVMCSEDSVCLPPASIDLAFLCDVYHHFEFPQATMRSIFTALRPGGRVVMIDFERIPGVSREWVLNHVRAGKTTFMDEVQSVGFELAAERRIPGLQENYYLEFRKPTVNGSTVSGDE